MRMLECHPPALATNLLSTCSLYIAYGMHIFLNDLTEVASGLSYLFSSFIKSSTFCCLLSTHCFENRRGLHSIPLYSVANDKITIYI